MAAEKVSRDVPEGEKAEIAVATLDSEDRQVKMLQASSSAAIGRRQTLSAYFTIAAAAFGLIRYVQTCPRGSAQSHLT